MKTRWMIKVESKIKDAPRGAPFILFSRALMPVTYWLKWSVTRYEWTLSSLTLRLIFWVHSKTNKCKRSRLIQHKSGTWMVDSHKLEHHSRLVQHMSGTWMVDSHELEHHSRLVQRMMAESWIPSPIDIYEWVRYILTISSTWMVASHKLEHHWWLSPGLLPWVTSIIWLSIYLFSVQWVTVTILTIALIVWTIDFCTHFSKNTNLETETSLPII